MAPGDLLARLTAAIENRPEVLEAYVFGSLARGEQQPHSDVDVAVYVDASRLHEAPYGYAAAITTDLMVALDRNDIDVVILNDAPPLLYHRVLRDGIRVFSRDLAATTTREGYALSRYCDYVPQLRKIADAQAARIAGRTFGR